VRGSPLIRALVAFFVILLAGYPLWRLTGAGRVVAAIEEPAPTSQEEVARPVHLELTFTRLPEQVQISHLGEEVWSSSQLELATEAKIEVPYPEQGIELVFSVKWPDGAPAALRVRVHTPSGEEHERTLWGEGETTEVLSFP
jgi:hypothetical protein